MRVCLFSDCYGRWHACVALCLRVWRVVSTGSIDRVGPPSQGRHASRAGLSMLALVCQLLQILLEWLVLDVVFAILALLVVGMCAKLYNKGWLYSCAIRKADIWDISCEMGGCILHCFVLGCFFRYRLGIFITCSFSPFLPNNECTCLFNCECTLEFWSPFVYWLFVKFL